MLKIVTCLTESLKELHHNQHQRYTHAHWSGIADPATDRVSQQPRDVNHFTPWPSSNGFKMLSQSVEARAAIRIWTNRPSALRSKVPGLACQPASPLGVEWTSVACSHDQLLLHFGNLSLVVNRHFFFKLKKWGKSVSFYVNFCRNPANLSDIPEFIQVRN